MFRATIHRGAREIGGSCVELECDGQRLVLDIGRPLDAGFEDELALPPIAGLDGFDHSLLGVVISHGHPDHYGLLGGVDAGVPVYIGAATARILAEARFFSPGGIALRPRGFLSDRERFSVGPFELTPYLVDHSAFDAYALLIEANGRRLFYSGDFRAHGRKASLFERLVAEPLAADTLLLEGTRIGERGDNERGAQCERDVEEQAVDVFRRAQGIVLLLYSPQNIDRLVTLFRAAKRAGRLFVLDLYAATITAATGRDSIPQSSGALLTVIGVWKAEVVS